MSLFQVGCCCVFDEVLPFGNIRLERAKLRVCIIPVLIERTVERKSKEENADQRQKGFCLETDD
jgi:hypothetical protein